MSKLDFTRSKYEMPTQHPFPHPVRDRIIAEATDRNIRRARHAKGKSLVPGGRNACGAVLAQHLCGKGKLLPGYKAAYATAQLLVNAAEQTGDTQRLPASEAEEPGVIVVCLDLNGNHLTDHVGLSLGRIYMGRVAQPGCFWMVDNQKPDPYQRNIGKGAKTPVLYCLRILL